MCTIATGDIVFQTKLNTIKMCNISWDSSLANQVIILGDVYFS